MTDSQIITEQQKEIFRGKYYGQKLQAKIKTENEKVK